jgi:hypothetical protein
MEENVRGEEARQLGHSPVPLDLTYQTSSKIKLQRVSRQQLQCVKAEEQSPFL